MKRIQIIGTQRSGSNLLRVMMHQHPDICAPHPPHLLKTFFPLLPQYGDLTKKTGFSQLVADMVRWVKLNPVSWENFDPDAGQLVADCSSFSVFQAFKSIYDWEARSNSKSTWVCKSMTNHEFVEQFEEEGIFDHYIFLFRDGRDVALSFSKAIVGPKTAYFCAKQWHSDQQASIDVQRKLGSKVIAISYEDLIENPLRELARLFVGIGMEMPANILDFPFSEESRHTAEAGDMWKNVANPVMPENKFKYLLEMPEEQQLIYESVAGESLATLGYRLKYWPATTTSFSSAQIEQMKFEEERLRVEAKKRTAPHDIELRRGQENFLRELMLKPV